MKEQRGEWRKKVVGGMEGRIEWRQEVGKESKELQLWAESDEGKTSERRNEE